jgi:hemoglobin/transferrin/lactoferrin receptor protein
MTKPIVAGLSLALASIVSAADTQPTNTLDKVNAPQMVVTATRDLRMIKDTPYSVSSLSATRLRIEDSARSVPEALKYEPGIMVQKTSHGQGSPYIRGFTSQRDLFLIDGIRLNNSVFREGPNQYWNTVDLLSFSRLDVARGPFSVLYGSDAIGGTINAITRGAHDLRPGSNWDRTLYYRYSSAEHSTVARAESIGMLTDKLALTIGYSYKDFGDIEGGKDVGRQLHTGYDENDWDAKLEYFFSDDASLTLAHQSVDIDDAWRTHKTIYGIDWKDLSVGKELRRSLDQSRDLTYLQYNQYNLDSFVEEIHANISYHQQDEDRDRLRSHARHDRQGFDVNTLGATLSLKSPTRIGTLIYGTEIYHDSVDSYKHKLASDGSISKSYIQGPVADDADYDTVGIYVQDEIEMTERSLLILGLRYEYADADADKVQDPLTGNQMSVSDSWDAFVGSARMLYYLDDAKLWNLFAGISQGFRAPNLSDLTRLDSARTDEIETPSPDLDPEYYISYETGIKADTEDLSTQIALFYTDIDGMIVRTPTDRIIDGDKEVTKKNGGDGYVAGLELSARYYLGAGFTTRGVFTWTEGKTDTYPTSAPTMSREYINRLMPPTGMLALRWDSPKRYWIEGLVRAAGKADKLSTRDKADTSRIPPGGTPSYTVCDIRAGWKVNDSITLALALENIADEDYRIHGSGINEPGRNIIASVQTTF